MWQFPTQMLLLLALTERRAALAVEQSLLPLLLFLQLAQHRP